MPALREWRDRALDRSRWGGALHVLSVWELLGRLGAPGAKANTATPDASARRVLLEQGLAMPTLPIGQWAHPQAAAAIEFVLVVIVVAAVTVLVCHTLANLRYFLTDPRLELAPDDDDEFKIDVRPYVTADKELAARRSVAVFGPDRWMRDIPGGEVMQEAEIGESVGEYVWRIIETECPPDLLAEGEIETTAAPLGGLHIVVERRRARDAR